MERRGLASGAKSWLVFLGRTVVFPLAWLWALGVARRHDEADPRARSKVLAGIAIGLVLTLGVGYLLYDFQEDARAGMYSETENRMALAVGESAYQEAWTTVNATDITLSVLRTRLAEAEGAGDEANATIFRSSIANATATRQEAVDARDDLQENHEFFQRIRPWIQDRQDERVLGEVGQKQFQTSEATLAWWDADRMAPRTQRAFEINDDAENDMEQVLVWVLLPGLIGVFYAPVVFALGSIMLRAWEPSETVGFKPYPGKSLGWFLLLGGFGWPSLLFAAWGFKDIEARTQEGQIAL